MPKTIKPIDDDVRAVEAAPAATEAEQPKPLLTRAELRRRRERAPDVDAVAARTTGVVLRWVGAGDPPDGQVSVGMEPVVSLPDAAAQREGFALPRAVALTLMQTHRPNYKAVVAKDGKEVEADGIPQ